jgi:hypothetical protein
LKTQALYVQAKKLIWNIQEHEERRLTIITEYGPSFLKWVLRKVFEHKADEVAVRWRKMHEEFHDCTPH